MTSLVRIAKKYLQDKKDAWNKKNCYELSDENPFILELKLTMLHFGDLYRIIRGRTERKEKGLLAALRYDAKITNIFNQ